jgi:hypothetical protein
VAQVVSQVKEPSYPTDRSLRGHESRPGSHGEKKNVCLLPDIELLLFDQPAGSLLAIRGEELNNISGPMLNLFCALSIHVNSHKLTLKLLTSAVRAVGLSALLFCRVITLADGGDRFVTDKLAREPSDT